jgi:hypothetical protein
MTDTTPSVSVAVDDATDAITSSVRVDPDALFTSKYGFHPHGTKWDPTKKKCAWEYVRLLSVEHPAIKRGNDVTHIVCINPMSDGKIGCGKLIKMHTRKLSQLTPNRRALHARRTQERQHAAVTGD